MNYNINDLLELVVQEKASDLHIHVGRPPSLRISGDIHAVEGPILTPEDTEALMRAITPEMHQKRLKEHGGSDFGHEYHDKSRFRISIFKAKGKVGMVLRLIPNKIFGLREVGLPEKVRDLLKLTRGLILVTGPTGSGKSTSLASMVNRINEEQSGHIITVEDPIEYFHDHKSCVVTQREVHSDVESFADALRSALRQDPDVILVGEMRDLETIEAAITAAETGHLVFGTLHTTGAAATVDRIIDAFPTGAKEQIRTQLSTSLVAVISQVLCRKKDGTGRVAAFELMVNTDSTAAKIRDGKTFQITSDMQTGAAIGMITLDAYLLNLYNQGIIDAAEAITYAQDNDDMRQKVKIAR